MAKSYSDLSDDELRSEHSRYQRKARRKSLYRRHVTSIESVMADRGMDVNPSPSKDPFLDRDETDESASEGDPSSWTDTSLSALQKAHEKYTEASEEYARGGWGDVVANIEAELSRREEFEVEELSTGQLGEQIGSPVVPSTVHGTAITAGEVTRGLNGKKKWHSRALRDAAKSLKGAALVKDHINDKVSAVVGQVKRAKFVDGAVKFEADVDDRDIYDKIEKGRLDVSARTLLSQDLETDDDGITHIRDPGDLKEFDNISVVQSGAAQSNEVKAGGMD